MLADDNGARAILLEALDTIEATFWVRNEEFKFASLADVEPDDPSAHVKVAPVGGPDDQYSWRRDVVDGKLGVTGVCSVGAVALARSTLYGTPLGAYDTCAAVDPRVRGAGCVLADTIVRRDVKHMVDCTEEAGMIASWNDQVGVTRTDVVATFRAALESPLLAARQAWWLYRDPGGKRYVEDTLLVWFSDEASALAFRAELVAAATRRPPSENGFAALVVNELEDRWSYDDFNRLTAEKVCEW